MVMRDRLMEAIGTLGLYGIRATLDEILAAGIKSRATPDKILCDLFEAELAERQVRSIRYRMSLAKFPVDKDLDRFDFTASPINEMQVRHLYDGNYLVDHTNIIMVGPTPRFLPMMACAFPLPARLTRWAR